jgi:hypothetical protein
MCLGRFLLFVAAIELLTMPVTQGLWTWDKFLHGGQDFELGLLAIITCLCLILLRTEQSKRSLDLLLLIKTLLLNAREHLASTALSSTQLNNQPPKIPPGLSAAPLNLPLLI